MKHWDYHIRQEPTAGPERILTDPITHLYPLTTAEFDALRDDVEYMRDVVQTDGERTRWNEVARIVGIDPKPTPQAP